MVNMPSFALIARPTNPAARLVRSEASTSPHKSAFLLTPPLLSPPTSEAGFKLSATHIAFAQASIDATYSSQCPPLFPPLPAYVPLPLKAGLTRAG